MNTTRLINFHSMERTHPYTTNEERDPGMGHTALFSRELVFGEKRTPESFRSPSKGTNSSQIPYNHNIMRSTLVRRLADPWAKR